MKRLVPILVLLLCAVVSPVSRAATTSTIVNSDASGGQISRFDVDGNALDAHDGSLLQVGDVFYLYGTSYACGYRYRENGDFCGFKVYSSPDLVHWTDRGYVTAPGACGYCFRPHVIHNAATGRYVMWADAGGRYLVATSPTPTGIFTPAPDPALAVGGAVDESLFVDDDGTGYLIHNTTQVEAGLTADMVVERLTPDYLSTTGQHVRLGLGDVEAFTVVKRGGVYHALMSDPSCAYCSGATGEMTATSMLGPWSGAWYDPNGVHQSGRPEPRWRARIVNADNCGGQPLAAFPLVAADGSTGYYFLSDRWNDRAPNESLANFFLGPLSFDAAGTLRTIECVPRFTLSLPGSPGAYRSPPDLDQRSGFDGFRHHCDVAGTVVRQQGFTPSRTGTLSAASITTFRNGTPNAPVVLEVVDTATGTTLSRNEFPVGAVPWAPNALTARPGIAVVAGHQYLLRLRSTTTTGCYGWEYGDADPYPSGVESYSTDGGRTFTAEPGRDLKFTTDVSAIPLFTPPGPPAGSTRCAGEGERCSFAGTRVVHYGAGTSYRSVVATDGVDCRIAAFGGDPLVGTLKSCHVAPAGGPAGSTFCAAEDGTCAVDGPAVVAYGAGGLFAHRLVRDGRTACTNAAFGGDPAFGVVKACHRAPEGGPPGWTACAPENGTCAPASARTVAYGARGAFVTRWVTGPVSCTNAAFGTDPIPGVVKACYLAGV
ncbi:family 43 glycosylhydrolase [Umezawaea endophytica]|uniref:Family 43 glycosylhydrolase n=1 Tax=Umezawaea endophytica TaxID=1654476 RepID=A0A9X3A2R8_9PSEU|nr:family 43 glycosylhydrolase [Umezawaea endophytica]MCS7479398.1 family 43 glycosylhydrolase [Umezawaea endophytica]